MDTQNIRFFLNGAEQNPEDLIGINEAVKLSEKHKDSGLRISVAGDAYCYITSAFDGCSLNALHKCIQVDVYRGADRIIHGIMRFIDYEAYHKEKIWNSPIIPLAESIQKN